MTPRREFSDLSHGDALIQIAISLGSLERGLDEANKRQDKVFEEHELRLAASERAIIDLRHAPAEESHRRWALMKERTWQAAVTLLCGGGVILYVIDKVKL